MSLESRILLAARLIYAATSSMERYICIHAHLYQPPRENPWLETVEVQDSAYPFHDWNQRITSECYAANASARILDNEGCIASIANNYSKISFNFGPTLLSWMEKQEPEVYRAILEADRLSQERFSGHGSAIAQGYNHMILPLANDHDRYTQVYWGIRDFESRFHRAQEGMWLPETAVDLQTLDIMAQLGIKFTILSPYQAFRFRRVGGRAYRDATGGKIDPSRPYLVRLRDGRGITVFFYDGPISQAVAFERLLNSGEQFAHRLAGGFVEARDWPQLMHIATDGESYGHHHAHGDMALAYALQFIEEKGIAKLTNYGEYLEKHPPEHEAQVIENSAWSCSHGVGRWRENCGCSSGGRAGWSQSWRGPLRQALDWLRDTTIALYEQRASALFADIWKARNEYAGVILDRSRESLDRFFSENALRELSREEQVVALELLEMQRHAMLMYTSCGWFFDEISGIESGQVIAYAGRVVQLAQKLSSQEDGDAIEAGFLERLAQAKSNLPAHGDGAQIYQTSVKPAVLGLQEVAAHYAISSIFETGAAKYSYTVDPSDYRTFISGKMQLAVGRAEVCSQITQESEHFTFGVLHMGDHTLSAGVRSYQGEDSYTTTVQELQRAFSRADIPGVIRVIDRNFGGAIYSLKSLFRDEQRRIMDHILESTLREAEASLRAIYEHHAPLMRFLSDVSYPRPKALAIAAEFVINASLRREFRTDFLDLREVKSLLTQAKEEGVQIDSAGLGFLMERKLNGLMLQLQHRPQNLGLLRKILSLLEVLKELPFAVNLWKVENLYYQMSRTSYPDLLKGTSVPAEWFDNFLKLGRRLRIRVEAAPPMQLAIAT
jgi:alpha-amylase/alpha-mannosidase (GH57 family)